MNEQTQQLTRPYFRRPCGLINIDTRTRHDLSGERMAIGRLPENKIPLLDDPTVSSLHATLYFDGQMWWLQDLKSTNGTLKNKTPVTTAVPIEPGDILTVGNTKFEVI